MICTTLILLNFLFPLTNADIASINSGVRACKEQYKVCAKSVEKTGELDYKVMCE